MDFDLTSHEADLVAAIRRVETVSPFAEILAEQSAGQRVRVDRKQESLARGSRGTGTALRAWAGDRWTEAAVTALDRTSLLELADGIVSSLAGTSIRAPPPGVSSTTVHDWSARPKQPARDLDVDAQFRRARELHRAGRQVEGIRDTIVDLGWSENERFYLNTAGARCFRRVSMAGVGVTPIAAEGAQVTYDHIDSTGTGGQERIEMISDDQAVASAKMAVALLSAGSPPSGEMNVLLDPAVAGTFAHESFGHGTEADQFVRERSYLAPIMGQIVGPEELSIVDDGTLDGGYGTIYCDDEGTPARRTTLIDHGRFVGALHDRTTAAALGQAPTGNARRADVLSRVYVRMTNTFVVPGTHSFEELVREAGSGVFMERWTSGVEDPLGGQMQIKVLRGRRIEHGELGPLVGSMALSGTVLGFLRSIRGIGRDGLVMDSGSCGKGHTDSLPVGSGGTAVLSRAVVGPA